MNVHKIRQFDNGALVRRMVKEAVNVHNANPSVVTDWLSPIDAELPKNLMRVRLARQIRQLATNNRNFDKLKKAKKFEIGQLVWRRVRQRGGITRSGETAETKKKQHLKATESVYSKSTYRIIAIRNTMPLQSYVLQNLDTGIAYPGSLTAFNLRAIPTNE
jgi:hypothetical protein